MITSEDEQRSLSAIRDALCHRYNNDAFERVIYSESHDEVANGRARVPQEVSPAYPKGWYSAETLDAGCGHGVHRARHSHALPRPGIP